MIREKTPKSEIVIDLTGPEGNAFVLLGYAEKLGKQLGMSNDEIKNLVHDMKKSDYEHLLEVFDKTFGEFVILER
jgi:hypothetical protein